jgi:hypothetical protein
MWVTRSIPVPPALTFVGADLPTLAPKLQLVGTGQTDGHVWKQSANISLLGTTPEVPFVSGVCAIGDVSKGVKAIDSLVIGNDKRAQTIWRFSGYQALNGTRLASKILETLVQPTYTRKTEFDLVSANPTAVAHERFSPEYYLQDGDHVEYKIPKQARRNLNFTYRQNGLTIEEQANNQDALEVRLHPIRP